MSAKPESAKPESSNQKSAAHRPSSPGTDRPAGSAMTRMTHAEAIAGTLMEMMESDPRFSIIGRGILGHGAQAHHDHALMTRFADRIIDPPTSEGAVASMAIGAAMSGLRMFLHFGTASFALEAWNQIVHEAGTAHSMSGGQIKVPLVMHMFHGLRGGGAAQHSFSPQSMLANVPGLKLMMPTTPADVKGMLRAAILCDDPVLFVDHGALLGTEGDVPDEPYLLPLGTARIAREGRDITIAASSRAVLWALEAAAELARDGIDAEVFDARSLVPFDKDSLLASVRKTGHLVTVDESPQMCSIGSEMAAIAAEGAFDALKAPILRVARPAAPVSFSPPLEAALTPGPELIAATARRCLGR